MLEHWSSDSSLSRMKEASPVNVCVFVCVCACMCVYVCVLGRALILSFLFKQHERGLLSCKHVCV